MNGEMPFIFKDYAFPFSLKEKVANASQFISLYSHWCKGIFVVVMHWTIQFRRT